MEIVIIFVLLLALAVGLFFGGPTILGWVVALGELIEAKVDEWKRIFRALGNGED